MYDENNGRLTWDYEKGTPSSVLECHKGVTEDRCLNRH